MLNFNSQIETEIDKPESKSQALPQIPKGKVDLGLRSVSKKLWTTIPSKGSPPCLSKQISGLRLHHK